jgi:hypothetical protein
MSKAFSISKNTAAIDIVEIEGHVLRKSHTLQCRDTPCTKTKLNCIKHVSHTKVSLDYF